jgi:adsorption protein B
VDGATLIAGIDAAAHEATLFAAIWFLVGGIDDLLVDLIYFGRRLCAWVHPSSAAPCPLAAPPPGRIAVFIPAWDESAVIGDMLRTALARFDHTDYVLYVGAYPNDPATIAAVRDVAAADCRVRLVIGGAPGPTTKADCLNNLWHAMLLDEAAQASAVVAVALHDAEDVVHPLELRIYAQWLQRYSAIQLPVMPLPHPRSRLVAGHYCDEFAEAHGKSLVVRQALGAGMPLAGVGCAVRRDMLGRIADMRGDGPFDATSLTEDYELGLTVAALGGETALVRVPERPGGRPVAVRAYFPDTLNAAIRQKARWLTGIALIGWDRTGWGRIEAIGDHWMRMRDRRATLAIPVLAIAYAAFAMWGTSLGSHLFVGSRPPGLPPLIVELLLTNAALLVWRLSMRALFVWRGYGVREALWSLPRVLVGNLIALFAARRALLLYLKILAGAAPRWDKTAHQFPDDVERVTA